MLLSWREKFHTSGYSIGQWIKAYQLTGFSISYQKGICWLLYLCAAYGIFLSILVYHIASWSSSAWGIRICFSGYSIFHILFTNLPAWWTIWMLCPSNFFTLIFPENMVFPSCDFCLNEPSKQPVGWYFCPRRPVYYPIYCHAAWVIHILLIWLLADICAVAIFYRTRCKAVYYFCWFYDIWSSSG